MFIRVKKVKQYRYAYLVENKWRSSKSSCRQKVRKYLGRVHKLESNGKQFDADVSSLDFKNTILKLVEFELLKNGFAKNNEVLERNGIIADIANARFLNAKQNVVFEANEGFLCEHTLCSLLNFKARGYEEAVGYDLAHAVLEAGLAVPNELFVKIFEKVYKKELVPSVR
jgi:hypothetical protein